jgi:hypothetical protein
MLTPKGSIMPQSQPILVQSITFRCRFEMTAATPSGHEFCVFDFPGCKQCPEALHTVPTVGSSEDPIKSETWRAYVRALPAPRKLHSIR